MYKKGSLNLSNLDNLLEKATQYALNISNLWSSGNLAIKRSVQNMVFPEGILFDFKNDTYRTTRVNSIFALINSLSDVLNGNKNGASQNEFNLSRFVPGMGVTSFFSTLVKVNIKSKILPAFQQNLSQSKKSKL